MGSSVGTPITWPISATRAAAARVRSIGQGGLSDHTHSYLHQISTYLFSCPCSVPWIQRYVGSKPSVVIPPWYVVVGPENGVGLYQLSCVMTVSVVLPKN